MNDGKEQTEKAIRKGLPPLPKRSSLENAELEENGKFLMLDDVLWSVLEHHSFDDFGATVDTLTIMNFNGDVKEIYSFDECETFTFDNGE